MKNGHGDVQLVPEMLCQENIAKQETNTPTSIAKLEARILELEKELKKQKAIAEQGAKLMQIIWGDKFQSDSLH